MKIRKLDKFKYVNKIIIPYGFESIKKIIKSKKLLKIKKNINIKKF